MAIAYISKLIYNLEHHAMDDQLYKPTQTQPIDTLRFVLYARKSTEDEGSQVSSIDDQIKVCTEYAKRRKINIVKIIEERKSAKRFGNRPAFDSMLMGFGKEYDALIAYHPDRLSRNMREAGIIIDMLNPDNKLIKDLSFPTVEFSNDSSGRLMLAVLFSFATQYSEHLSETTARGMQLNLHRGKSSGTPMWGYDRSNITGYYEPDKNFELIKSGWNKRLDGDTIESIVEFWRNNGVDRMTKITHKNKKIRKVYITKSTASRIFSNPFYYGLLCQAGQIVDLREKQSDFKPMISEEDFNKVQGSRGNLYAKQLNSTKNKNFYPLRQFVNCGVCKKFMTVAPSGGHGGRYLYFRCDNKECTRNVRGVRARFIFDPMYKELDKMQFTDDSYNEYSEKMGKYIDAKLAELRQEQQSLIGTRNHINSELKVESRRYADIASDKSTAGKHAAKVLNESIEEQESKIKIIKTRLDEIKIMLNDPTRIKLSRDNFLNLVNSLSDKMRNGNPRVKDALCRILFLNLEIDNKNALSYHWKEPFLSLVESQKIPFGIPGGNRTPDTKDRSLLL